MNREQLYKGEWVVNVCNHFWWHYVYLFSAIIKAGQWVLHRINPEKFPDWKKNHSARFKDGYVIEMLANGKNTHETVEEWLNKQRRTLKVYRPLVPFVETPDKPYDYFGLVQKMLSYFRKYILRTGNTWNGTDGVPKDKDGFDCIEEVMTAMGEPDAHIWLPCRLSLCNKLEYVATIETEPINSKTMKFTRFLHYMFSGKNLLFIGFLLVLFLFGLYHTLLQQPGDGNEWIMIVTVAVFLFDGVVSYLTWNGR